MQDRNQTIINRYSGIVRKAHKDAEGILQHASYEGNKIAKDTASLEESMAEHVIQEMKLELLGVEQSYTEQVKRIMQKLQEESEKVFTNITTQADTQMKAYTDTIGKETLQIKQGFREKAEKEFEQLTREIQAYKEAEKKRLTSETDILIQKVANEVLRRSITQSEQEAILLQAFDEIKAERGTILGE